MSAIRNALLHIRQELETPRGERPIGSGWLSGSLGVLAGGTSLLMVIALRNPSLFLMPELSILRDTTTFRVILYVIAISGYLLSILSMMLRKDKTLGLAGILLTLTATCIGLMPPHGDLLPNHGLFFGLDFFVLNVLFMGLLFLPLERLFPRVPTQDVLRDEWREDLFYYLVSSLLVQVLTYLTLAPSKAVSATGHLDQIRSFAGSLPWLLQLVVIMLITDVVQYWVHRAFHRIPALWRFHAVHHSARHLDWIAGARMHFCEIIVLRSLTATPMFALGFQESAIQAYVLIVYVYSAAIHANIGTDFRWLEKVFVVPRFHHWHHGAEREAVDVNFAIHFPILDKVFGTHHMPAGRWPQAYGIEGNPVPTGYTAQFLYPFGREKRTATAQAETI